MYLVSLTIENLRAIRHLRLDFQSHSGRARTRRWTVLFGENGCGKSTVLKAIGLVLAGSEALSELLEAPDEWIRVGASSARVAAIIETAEGERREISLKIRRGERRDEVLKNNSETLLPLDRALSHADRNYFIAGYGAFRHPQAATGRDSFRKRGADPFARADNIGTLFSPQRSLVSLEEWIFHLDYVGGSRARQTIAECLQRLLPDMSFHGIDKSHYRILMRTTDGIIPLSQLSEGYQAMAAWAGDLLYRLWGKFDDRSNPLAIRGVLLIDEMDLHLHPTWKRHLVDYLDQAFPNLQLITTTHSPLSVQQCREGELFVIRREEQGPTLVPFYGDPSNMRLSDLFLSPLIGLRTLDSPRVSELKDEARRIELAAGTPSKTALRRLNQIASELGTSSYLANAEVSVLADLPGLGRHLIGSDVAPRISRAARLFGAETAVVARTKSTTSTPTKKKATSSSGVRAATASKKTTAKQSAKPVKSASKKTTAKKPAKPVKSASKKSTNASKVTKRTSSASSSGKVHATRAVARKK